MSTTQKKCPMCAEEIPLTCVICEYCGAQFEVTSTGYCQNCHQFREADENSKCKVCGNAVMDWRVESKFIEETTAQAVRSVPASTSITSKPSSSRIWMLGSVLALVVTGVAGTIFWFSKGNIDSLSSLSTTNTPTTELLPPSTNTLAPTRTPIPTSTLIQLTSYESVRDEITE